MGAQGGGELRRAAQREPTGGGEEQGLSIETRTGLRTPDSDAAPSRGRKQGADKEQGGDTATGKERGRPENDGKGGRTAAPPLGRGSDAADCFSRVAIVFNKADSDIVTRRELIFATDASLLPSTAAEGASSSPETLRLRRE